MSSFLKIFLVYIQHVLFSLFSITFLINDKRKKNAYSKSHTPQMNFQLNTFEDLNDEIRTRFFMNIDNFDYHSIKTLRIIFANLLRSALSFRSFIFALNIELIRRMQSEAAQAIANDVKDCISKSVDEIETKHALVVHDSEISTICEEYRLNSELSDECTLNVLQQKFTVKMSKLRFI